MKKTNAKYLYALTLILLSFSTAFAQPPTPSGTDIDVQQVESIEQAIIDNLETARQEPTETEEESCRDCNAFPSFDYWTPLTNLLAVALGALIGGIISIKMQGNQTRFEISRSLMDCKIKQLAELYGPLYALLHQSNAIYRQMNIALTKAAPSIFRLHEESEGIDFDKKVFEIIENNEWKHFRTITHFEHAYGAGYGVEIYFDELITIGERIAKVVEEKAGLIRDDQTKLADIFGQYLAHYTVLRQLHRRHQENLKSPTTKDRNTSDAGISIDKSAAFPRDIQHSIKSGFDKLNNEADSTLKCITLPR